MVFIPVHAVSSPNNVRNNMQIGRKKLPVHLIGGVQWKRNRKILNPFFNLKTLQSFIPIFNKKIQNVVEELEVYVGKSGIDIMPYTNVCSLETLCGES